MSAVAPSPVFEGLTLIGDVNTDVATVAAHVSSSIRRQYPQVWPTAVNTHRVVLVGGGPSLEDTFDELKALVFAGAKLVALNGSYQWLLDRNLQPRAHIVLDARPESAALIGPPVPDCRYYICSQCAPETWEAVAGRPHVAIWHAGGGLEIDDVLNAYYLKHWVHVTGGTTVGTRAIALLRTLGYLRFDLFGFDSCWRGDKHHAYPQAQNDRDRRYRLTIEAKDRSVPARSFDVAPWHVQQLEDLVLFMRAHGDKVLLRIHGDGLLAYALAAAGSDVVYHVDEE